MTKLKIWWASHKPTKRRIIQLYAALLTNANLKGFSTGRIYQGDVKAVCAPGLNCYSCPGAAAACPLGALQNAIANSGKSIPYYVFGILLLYGFLFGRWICGFLCPFGLIQDLLHKIPTPKIKKSRVTRVLSWLKYVILVVFVVLLPLIYALQQASLPLPAFCKYICPSGTLLGAFGLLSNEANDSMFSMLGPLFTWKFCLLVGIVVACVFCYRSFCRFLCPLGAIYGLFNRISLVGMDLDRPKCVDCGKCIGVCKMDIRHVGDHECISCGDCISVCPTAAIRRKGPKILLVPNEVGGEIKSAELGQINVIPKKTRVARAVVGIVMALVLATALVYYNVIDVEEPPAVTPSEPSSDATVPSGPVVGNQVGNVCPDTQLRLIGFDRHFSLSETRGKVTIVNFWGTWCASCVAELQAEFPLITQEYADTVAVVTVHTTFDVPGAADPIEFVTQNFADSGYINCWDNEGEAFYNLFGDGQSWPYTVVLDRDGVIVTIISGSTTYEELKDIIDPLLAD